VRVSLFTGNTPLATPAREPTRGLSLVAEGSRRGISDLAVVEGMSG